MSAKAKAQPGLTVEEYVAQLVADLPPLTPEQIEGAARILASVDPPALDRTA